MPSQLFLRPYDLKYNKIASAMLTHLDLVRAVAEEKRPTFYILQVARESDGDEVSAARRSRRFVETHLAALSVAAH